MPTEPTNAGPIINTTQDPDPKGTTRPCNIEHGWEYAEGTSAGPKPQGSY